jgi:hypothetical protein
MFTNTSAMKKHCYRDHHDQMVTHSISSSVPPILTENDQTVCGNMIETSVTTVSSSAFDGNLLLLQHD